eukprot:253206_1
MSHLQWDEENTQLLKSLFPIELRHLIMRFIFTNNCINCNKYVDLYCYFCKQCALKRLIVISKGDIHLVFGVCHYEVDTSGIWGISVENEDTAEDEYDMEEGYVTYRIYHLLSGTLIYTSNPSYYFRCYYERHYNGSFHFKFCDQILQPYVVSYSIHNGDEKTFVKKELHLAAMKVFQSLDWHFEGNINSLSKTSVMSNINDSI